MSVAVGYVTDAIDIRFANGEAGTELTKTELESKLKPPEVFLVLNDSISNRYLIVAPSE